MADSSEGLGAASFVTQANALLRKNATFQKRNMKTNCCIISFPVIFCLLIGVANIIIHNIISRQPEAQCDGNSMNPKCPIASPPKWLPLLQVPRPESRACRADYIPFTDLPDESCRRTQKCPATILLTGGNRSFAESVGQNLFPSLLSLNISEYGITLPASIMGTDSETGDNQFDEPAFYSLSPLYVLQSKCTRSLAVPLQIVSKKLDKEIACIEGLPLWRDNSSLVNDELFKGYPEGNKEKKSNEITAAYDFLTSNENRYMINIWYNSTNGGTDNKIMRVPRSVNAVSNAYLRLLRGNDMNIQFEYVKEMPRRASDITWDISIILRQLFVVWILELIFPVILTNLVYEKQHKLKIMMKMHGLGDGPYWMISYAYFFCISFVYALLFRLFGDLAGISLFRLNANAILYPFLFIYTNLQVALAFFVATFFSDVKTAQVIGYIYVFASGLLGEYLFKPFVEDASFSRTWVLIMEIFPGFSLFRGIYELYDSSLSASVGASSMQWRDLDDSSNGMKVLMILMSVEWLVLLLFAFFLDKVGIGNTLCFWRCFQNMSSSSSNKPGESVVLNEMTKDDIAHEKEVVEKLLLQPSSNYAIICNNMKKVYPSRDGNPEKCAVKGLSLALPQTECFGMLGPNGAGKTSWISMMTGLTKPTSGTAYVQGMDIRFNMDKVYTRIGVCPQQNLLWGTLTGREHLLFYGRLKNLKGHALTQAVEHSLKSLNLFHGGVADKQAGKYSGGMKRRLSVAIALIGDPKVVYLDEPSTGLDPASKNHLWNTLKRAKQDRAIVLTTHSMEEAEYLCDRLGIFVDGEMQCVGNPKELKARYGGTYILTMTTTSEDNEEEVAALVHGLSSHAIKIYHLSGTQKFEIPKKDVTIAGIFHAVGKAKSRFPIQAWGLTDTTLEDVFIKVAKGAEAFSELS
ncbi:ABC transporter A family member 7-like [Asparagus officinalis]|uniref:ABC transporter A family member 7-like n=1 Tax=Asparagus officinalis TaxID=4686 RepID=UPI00098E7DD4|nr:ABC transporter A family member 7-like [Asparagus officinalis]